MIQIQKPVLESNYPPNYRDNDWLPEKCPECGSYDTSINEYDEIICGNCGYNETEIG